MHIIKYTLLGILALVILILIIALFMSKDMNVSKQVTINKPLAEVFNYVKYLKHQDEYSKWGTMDSNMKKTYTGTDGTVGFISAWEGNKEVGAGEQEILKIDDGKRIDYALRFIKPFKSNADAFMIFEDAGNNQTKVSWGFKSQMAYPMNAICLFINMEEKVGADFQLGLDKLKKKLEN
ncbi:MAG: SRPBCC family protein [Bacteroidetes bacterium]|nr:SRPBCC family protein [Bacteroidota bacterium]